MTRARVRQTAAVYDAGAGEYVRSWAPVLRTLAERMLATLDVQRGARVLDVGCGPGTIAGALARDGSRVVGADIALGMLAHARAAGIACVAADVEHLPLAGGFFDVALSTFMLQHVPRPGSALAEAARALRSGGVLATATWGEERDGADGPFAFADEVLDRHGVPPAEPRRTWHHLVERPEQLRRYARGAGTDPVRIWLEVVSYAWTGEAFASYATEMGPTGRRLASLPPAARAQAAQALRARIAEASTEDLVWRPEIVFCVARKR